MGSCCGVLLKRSRRRHARHKRFDFAPKRSWKYKDASLLNEFHEMEMTHDVAAQQDDGQLIDDNGAAASSNVPVNHTHHRESISSDGEEEIDTGNYRPSGRLVFTEGDSDDEIVATPPSKGGYAQLDLDHDEDEEEDIRGRSQSTGSEQIGRFEVWDVDERQGKDSSCQDESLIGDLSKHKDEISELMSASQT